MRCAGLPPIHHARHAPSSPSPAAMNDLSPCLECALSCRYHDSPMCVSNLVMLADQHAPISLGLHVGLNHVYGEDGLPPLRSRLRRLGPLVHPPPRRKPPLRRWHRVELHPSLIAPASEAGFHPMVLIPLPGQDVSVRNGPPASPRFQQSETGIPLPDKPNHRTKTKI